ncbi:MAG: FAD:protein FMN transferase [Anaerolineae bacterium]|nr:FAD:protein FMN transferase [Anaerolineae bacterium]NUQ04485.1 FAD:protein FMN transferase [Anaerolineae bacterium]
MKQTRWLMGMPITVEIVDASADAGAFDAIYGYFNDVDQTFSPFKETSEVSRVNRGELALEDCCADMQIILELAEQTRLESHGYFDVWNQGRFNPSGIVKGWAIDEAASLLYARGFRSFYVDAGGDVQVYGRNARGQAWSVGICNPFDLSQIVKTATLDDRGIATSGSYMRGAHIYNPHSDADALDEIVSITVIGPDVLEADRFATAAFAMGRAGVYFIESLPGLEAYMIDRAGRATMTSHFRDYTAAAHA